jgi:hypothetical protein
MLSLYERPTNAREGVKVMATYPEYLPEGAIEKIIAALGDAYYDNGGEWFRPEVGNTTLSFAIAAWQSSLHNLKKAFPTIDGEQQCVKIGNVFFIQFPKCRIQLFKFRPLESADGFRLVGSSRNREDLVGRNEQMALFQLPVRDLIVIHTGTPDDGLLEVHIGAPLSPKRTDDSWIWRDEVFNQALDGTYSRNVERSDIKPYSTLEEPTFEVVPETEEQPSIEPYTQMAEADFDVTAEANAEEQDNEDAENRNS